MPSSSSLDSSPSTPSPERTPRKNAAKKTRKRSYPRRWTPAEKLQLAQDIEDTIRGVCLRYRVLWPQLIRPLRNKLIDTARREAMIAVHRKFPLLTMEELARIFSRHRTTVSDVIHNRPRSTPRDS